MICRTVRKWDKMKELNYKKIICALGHSSEAVPFDMPLPGKCPVCGQPYDRRYNRPVPCLRDGTVPEEEADQRERQAAAGEEGGDIPMVRGRRNMPAADPDMQIHMTGTRRRRTAGETVGEAGTEEVPVRTEEARRGNSRGIVLYAGGEKIPVPEEKGYLGRDGLGADMFRMNLLVSRRHAQIYGERFGNVYVRDEDSLNGTFVDDGGGRRRLLPGETAQLKAGDKLWLADQLLVVWEDKE